MRKRIRVLTLIAALCVMLTGCANAKADYSNDKKIASGGDQYSKVSSVYNSIDGGNSFRVAKFNGRETLRTDVADEEREMDVLIRLGLEEGMAKVVFVDADGSVTVLAERQGGEASKEPVSCTVTLKKGYNKIKLVGYDCKGVDLELLYPETI